MSAQTRPHVLLVDDDSTIREHLAPVLRRSGLDTETAADGVEALQAIEARRPDLSLIHI